MAALGSTFTVVALAISGLTSLPAAAAPPITIHVGTTTDAVDPTPNDATCDTVAGPCSLRAAVQTAAGTADASRRVIIRVPAGTYTLTLSDQSGSDDESGGDLGINSNVDIIGNGSGSSGTIIDGGAHDRVFETGCDTPQLQTEPTPVHISISGVTVTNGSALSGNFGPDDLPVGGGILNCQTLLLDNVVVSKSVGFLGGGVFSARNPFATGAQAPKLTVRSSNISQNETLAGGGIWNQDGPVTVSKSTIEKNLALVFGGGVYNASATATVVDSVVSTNGATLSSSSNFGGAGLLSSSGQLNVLRSRVSDNLTFGLGGGIYVPGGGLRVDSSRIQDNGAEFSGGGIVNAGSGATILDTTISGNQTLGNGGGLDNQVPATLKGDTFNGNTADNGGAISDTTFQANPCLSACAPVFGSSPSSIASLSGSKIATLKTFNSACAIRATAAMLACGRALSMPKFTAPWTQSADGSEGRSRTALASTAPPGASMVNTTISGNHAVPNNAQDPTEGHGGGIYNQNAITTAKFTTIADNTSATGSDQIAQQSSRQSPPGLVELWSTIVSGSSTNCDASVDSHGHNLDSGNSCGFTSTGDGVNKNPRLEALANNGGLTRTRALKSNSPAIEAGGACPPPATDQRGLARPQGPRCDIGAYEVKFVPPPSPSPNPSPSPIPSPVTPVLPKAGFQPTAPPSVMELLWPLLAGLSLVGLLSLARRSRA